MSSEPSSGAEPNSCSPNPKGEQFTEITFKPDFAEFHMREVGDDFEGVFGRGDYNAAGKLGFSDGYWVRSSR